MADKKHRLLVLTGPTASGKTALGVALARRLDGEIVSADSMQVYRGMDIGTAKVRPEETGGVPHHLIDVAEPREPFSVSRWVELAQAAVEDILARGRQPILVGGTNLYLDSLLSGRDFAAPADAALRAELNAQYERLGGAAFREALRAVDPERAERLAPADKKRLVRAMEVWLLSGETISAHDARTRALPPRWPSLRVALSFADRQRLYARIDARVDQMAAAGLFDEVAALLAAGLDETSTAMQAIGYKEAAAALRGECSRDEALARIRQESRRYAKRQLTWLRRDPELHWLLWDKVPDIPRGTAEVLALWQNQNQT
ncbi:MAG: tRNA (adenosine(37)-N6)-dimethylallyltransferase MiaA [Oscillospiraceae bacterium]|nr:tRNA (adenosine(37)-N6)-dimethylallyltransferase MiaA [Oscillospiraceae bacterium]